MGDRPPRFFVPSLPPAGGPVELDSDANKHARVLRLAVGRPLVLFDGSGSSARAVVDGRHRGMLLCHCEPPTYTPASTRPLTLIVGITKGSKLDLVARTLTELGVDRLGLAHCERTVPEPRDPAAKRDRLVRISLSACAQSGQVRPLQVFGPAPLLELAAEAAVQGSRLVLWERALAPLPTGDGLEGPVSAVIGPEGGLSDGEVSALVELGYAPVGLGEKILRAETAASTAAVLLLDRLNRLASTLPG